MEMHAAVVRFGRVAAVFVRFLSCLYFAVLFWLNNKKN